MGAVCGKGHRLKDDEAPYETKENAPRSAEKSASKKKTDSAPASAAEIAENGHENLIEEVEDEIQQKRAEEVKSEVKPPAAGGGGGKVQFPEQQDIQKYIDPEKSSTCFGTDLDGATLVAQKSEVFIPSVFHYTYGLNCCACRLPLHDVCTVILGYTFHQSCLRCVTCNAPLSGVKKKSDITIMPSGQLFCDTCSVKNTAELSNGADPESVEEKEDSDLYVAVVGRRVYHVDVKCCNCQLPLSSVKLQKNEQLFCLSCYADLWAPSCHLTNRKIIGRSLQIDSKNYLIDAVKCPKCGFKICENEEVYIVEGQPPVHMDCSKSVSAEFYRTTTDDEGVLSPFEDLGSDSDRGGHFSEARKTKSDISYSSINTSFSSLPFPRTEKPENTIPAVYRLKYANQYVGSYLKPERDFKAKTADAAFIGSLLQSPNSNKLPNGSKVNVNGGIKPNLSPKPVQNGRLSTSAVPTKPGLPTPRKIDSHDYSGPLAAVYYKKERERRRQEKARMNKINKADVLRMSANPSGGKFANGHASESGMSESENELDVTRSFSQTGDVSMRAYEGDISVATNLDSTNISSDGESPVNKNLPRTVMIQRGARNGAISEGSDTENETMKAPTNIASSDTENDTTDGAIRMSTYANGDVPVGKRGSLSKTLDSYGSDHESKGGYITEDEIDRMKSGLGKEILREMKVQMDSTNKDEVEALQVPDDPIKASRSPDAKTEVQLPYFCELKFGPIATGINRYCDSWLLEQASKEPMSLQDYSSFMHGFHRFTNASNEPWKNSIPNSLADGAMSDTEGLRRYTTAGGGSSGTGSRLYSGYKSDGYKSDIGGYNSSPEMGRRKMIRYNSLDVRKAWYHERFLTYVQMYHRKGNLLFEQQKEACMQHIRKSIGSLSRSADLKVYPKEKLFTNMNKRLPEDVKRSRLEMHLSDEDFVDLFAMTQDQFKALPPWKQNVLKQLNYLF